MFNFILKTKYSIVRIIEKIPLIQILVYNLISNFHSFFPHEKDYYGLLKLVNLKNKRDFIDIGGNIGLSTIGFRQLGFTNRIIIFEPDKEYCCKKLHNLKKKISNIKLLKFGLSDKDERQTFYQAYFFGIKMHFLSSFDEKYLKSIIYQVYYTFRYLFKIKKQKLSLKKFDQLNIKVDPVFIKIDVEGFDHKVIYGMLQTIKKYKPIILVELNRENFNQINSMLQKYYDPFIYNFEKDFFKRILKKDLNYFRKKFKRNLNFSSARNIYFLPKN